MTLPNYYMFIDESGDASLNNKGKDFVLSTVIIEQKDFEIIQGYLRLLKRHFFKDDYKVLHTTDLFERSSTAYPELFTPKDKTNAFMYQLGGVLETVPYSSCVYHVDKDKLRKKLNYKPAKGRRLSGLNNDLPYELTATQAILDFTAFLKNKKSTGEIVIESRLHKDNNFVTYFDNARKPSSPGGKANPTYNDVRSAIPSLFISNKESGNSGLEMADVVSYIVYRTIAGDPYKKIKVTKNNVNMLFAHIKKSAHIGTPVAIICKIKV